MSTQAHGPINVGMTDEQLRNWHPRVTITPTPTQPEVDRRYGWMRGFTYQDLCQRLAEGHHDET